MAIPQVGSINVDFLHGLPQKLRPRVDTWEVPGLDGYGAQTLGKGNAPFEFQTIKYCTDNSAANTFITSCLAVQGTVLSVRDNWDDLYPNVLLLEAVPTKQPAIWADGAGDVNADGVRVVFQWKAVTSS